MEQIQDVAEQTLIAANHLATARAYIVYREQHAQLRADKQTLVDVESSINEYLTRAVARWLADASVIVVIVQTQKHEFDAGRCAQNMMLAAYNDGAGSCPAHLPESALASLLGIPAELSINRVIGFGYINPDRAGAPPSVARKRLPLEELVHQESW